MVELLCFLMIFYVAKHICRDDLMPLKYCLDNVIKQEKLFRMLEWKIGIDHNWSVKSGVYGKGLKKYLSPEIWSELESTYVGADKEENWEALFRTIDIFRRVALEVAIQFGFSYPHNLDDRAMQYLYRVRNSADKL